MAEIIRRSAEDHKNKKFPEEDEVGYGQWMPGARKMLYGTERVLDADRATRREFLTTLGLESGIKVRCYIEGETEYGSLSAVMGEGAGVEFVNLSGQVVASRSRGLSFVDSLRNDQENHIFSCVVIDGDREDYVRAMRSSVYRGVFFGRFFISEPDFALSNFTVYELLEVARQWEEFEFNLPDKETIIPDVGVIHSESDVLNSVQRCGLRGARKGAVWGEALMRFALENPQFPDGDLRAGQERPCIEVVRFLINARKSGYTEALDNFVVDSGTGSLKKK